MEVLLVIDATIKLAQEGYIPEHHEVVALEQARAAVAELIAATPSLLALYRIKWGNLDPDANAVLATFERAFSRVGGGK